MMEYYIDENKIDLFEMTLKNEEKSRATVEKYLRDVRTFFEFLGEEKQVTKEKVIVYKNRLIQSYAPASVNSVLASLNCFFKKNGWLDCAVKALKIQREAFRSGDRELTKEEYYRLLETAKRKKKHRLCLVMETLCSTGIRVSELPYITVETLCTRRAVVSMKGKTRTVLLSAKLCQSLRKYVREQKIKGGSIFVTRTGKPLDRSNILHEMKALCEEAKIEKKKVFPHNLRHLFAVTYYQTQKDLTHLADLLGHSNINTTRIYTLVNGEEQERQIDLLGLVI